MKMNRRDFVKYSIGTGATVLLEYQIHKLLKQKKEVVKALGPRNNYFVYNTNNGSGVGNGSDSLVYIALIPWKHWRVVDCGFRVVVNCASNIPEKVNIGIVISDIGTTDDDYFGSWTQDTTANKQWVNGDMIVRVGSITQKVDPSANGGTATFTAGSPDGLNVWQSTQALLCITKKNVAGSTGNITGWVLVEVEVRNDFFL